jgi:branched-chain amino acid transport system permease protein
MPRIPQSRAGGSLAPVPKGSGARSRLLGVVALLALALLPAVVSSPFDLQVLTLAFVWATLAGGLMLQLGYAGMLTLAHASFFGVGAYTAAVMVTNLGTPLELALLVGGVLAGVGGLGLGLVSLKVKGDYFCLASLAFAIALYEVMQNATSITRGRGGFYGIPAQSLFGFNLGTFRSSYYAALGLLAVTSLVVSLYARSFAGRALLAVRYDELAAASAGVDVGYTKVLITGFTSFLAGIAGGIFMSTMLFIRPDDFHANNSFMLMLYVMMGGMTNLWAVLLSAGGVVVLTQRFPALTDYRVGVIGVLVLLMVYQRGGILKDLLSRRPRVSSAVDGMESHGASR